MSLRKKSLREIISEICEHEAGLYLDYYNGKIKSYKEFIKKLERHKKDIIEKVYDLLEEGYDEKVIIAAIKEQGLFYKESPEWFGEDDDSSNYPSGYYETNKNKKYPFHEKCGYTLSLVKRFFATRKSVKTEYAYHKSKYNNIDDGIREKIYHHIKTRKSKTKRKRKKTKRKK